VDSVKPGEDGHVRTVDIRYTNPGKAPGERSPPKITTRPIHKIAVIVPVDYVFEDDRRSGPEGPGFPTLAKMEASGPEKDTSTQPDSASEDAKQPELDRELDQKTQAIQAPGAAVKKGPGRPRKKARTGAEPGATQPANSPETDERPRRKAAIRAEENMRKQRDRIPEAWPLLQTSAGRRRPQQRD
jgi:hypothetical protein